MATCINIPFRCPNCGDSGKFKTLHQLRTHLQTEHAFIYDQSKRPINFSGSNRGGIGEHTFSHQSSLLGMYQADTRKLEDSLRKSKEEELNNKRIRREFEGLTSTRMNIPARGTTFGSCPPKTTSRENAYSRRLNRHLNPDKFTSADNRLDNPHHSLHYIGDQDFRSDHSPFEDRKFSALNKTFSEQLDQEAIHKMASCSNSEARSDKNRGLQLPRKKQTDDKHIIETLNTLSQDVLLGRASQHATANSLYTTQEVLSGIEQAAEERLVQQQFVINDLAQELKDKEKRLANVMHEMESLHYQQLDGIEKINLLKQKYDHENKQLHQELQQKQMELDSFNKQISESEQSVIKDSDNSFQRPEKLSSNGESKHVVNHVLSAVLPVNSHVLIHSGSENIKNSPEALAENIKQDKLSLDESSSKDKELVLIKMKAQQLERDKHNLLMEMQSLLEAAASDNDKLKAELDSRTEKLSKMSSDLEQSKQEQGELLDETNSLYHQADVSLSVLKTMLKERGHQLVSMSGSLQQAKANQEKLIKERDECLVLAKEREAMYRSMLAANSLQVKSVKEILESSQEEKLKLEEGLRALKGKLAAKEEKDKQLRNSVSRLQAELAEKDKVQTEMKEKVRRREEKLKKAQREMNRVTHYLKATAGKELEARSGLEAFIGGLIDRAGKAETELHKLKSCQVPRPLKKFSKEHEFNQQPVVSSRTLNQDKFNIYGVDDKATNRLNNLPLHYQPQEKLLQFHRSPEVTVPTASTRHSRYPVQQRSEHQQSPMLENLYGHGVYPETSLYQPSSLHEESHLTFENTPEVEKMFQSGSRFAATKPVGNLNSQNWCKGERDKPEQLVQIHRQQDLSIDDNGIMWEQSPPYFQKYANKRNDNYELLLKQRAEYSQINDDTDVDEDLNDYMLEEEQMSHSESEKAQNLTSKSMSASNITKIRMDTLQKDPIQFNEKIVKLFSSVEPEDDHLPTKQVNNKHFYSHNLQQSKLHVDNTQNNASQKKSGPIKAANDYSTTESSETGPIKKAMAVKKRVEQLTSMNSSLPRANSSSRQSGSFEVSNLDRDSDFSSSSYASFGHCHSHQSKQEETKQYTKEEKYQACAVKDSGQCMPNSSTLDESNPDFVLETSVNAGSIYQEPNKCFTDIPTAVYENDPIHSDKDSHVSQATDTSSALIGEKFIEKQPANSQLYTKESSLSSAGHVFDEDIQKPAKFTDDEPVNSLLDGTKESLNPSADPVLDKDTNSQLLPDNELAQYTDAELKSAKELRITSQSETQNTSSEEDLPDDSVSTHSQSLHRKNVEASTDTDLEMFAMPGHLQKGFAIKKIMPNIKRIKHKKRRRKAPIKKFPSQESLSSEPDELEDTERALRLAVRKMRIALFRVFTYLDTRTLLTVACVSKEWHKVSRHPALWRRVLLDNSSISSEFLITLSKWCTQTSSLSLKGLRGRDIMAEESLENYQLGVRGSLEPGLEKFLSTCHDTIKDLHITDCDSILTDKCLWLVSGYCRLLTTLTYLSSVDPITPQLMWALGGGCPGVTSLFVYPQQPCEKTNAMNNRCLLLIGQLYQDIQELGLGGKEFDRAGLLPLVQSCQNLKRLHLDHCLGITADLASALCKAGLRHLHTLTISGTYIEAKAVQNFKDSCRQLKRINVSVNIQDCVDDPSKKKDKETYKKMVTSLEALKAKSGFGIIFTLEAMPVS